MATPNKTPSPEETGAYKCPSCGNIERFTGIDTHGFGGPDECENDDEGPCEEYCKCETILRQDFDVQRDVDDVDDTEHMNINYHAFSGGSDDAEIGSYTTILCRKCNAIVWTEDGDLAEDLRA